MSCSVSSYSSIVIRYSPRQVDRQGPFYYWRWQLDYNLNNRTFHHPRDADFPRIRRRSPPSIAAPHSHGNQKIFQLLHYPIWLAKSPATAHHTYHKKKLLKTDSSLQNTRYMQVSLFTHGHTLLISNHFVKLAQNNVTKRYIQYSNFPTQQKFSLFRKRRWYTNNLKRNLVLSIRRPIQGELVLLIVMPTKTTVPILVITGLNLDFVAKLSQTKTTTVITLTNRISNHIATMTKKSGHLFVKSCGDTSKNDKKKRIETKNHLITWFWYATE